MAQIVELLAAGAVTFASTNVDNMVALLGLLADRTYRSRTVLIGHYVGVALLVAVSLIGALAAMIVPQAWVGLLGFGPILVGVSKMWAWLHPSELATGAEHLSADRRDGPILSIVTLVVAAGGDNLGAYIPLFATHSGPDCAVIVAVFAALTGVWYLVAHALVQRAGTGAAFAAWGRRFIPFFLIGLGAYVMWRAGSLGLVV